MNPFEQLCILASDEKWCWKLGCTTCGHLHFRYSFAELATGKSPADKDWLIHRRRTTYKKQLGPLPKHYSDDQEVRVLEICSQADISRIAERCKFPDWLGYLGLILEHMKCSHDSYQAVSSQWAQQLRDLSPPNSLIYARLDEIAANVNEFLTIEDLERFESSFPPDDNTVISDSAESGKECQN